MSTEKEQPRNINDKEIELIKRTFDEPMLKSIRALFFGLEITDREKQVIKSTFASPELMAIMVRRLAPQLDRDTPIGQVQDSWLGAETMVYGHSPETIYQAVHYKECALKMVDQAIRLLIDPDGRAIDLNFVVPTGPMSDLDVQLQVGLLARNQFIRHIEQQLLFLWLIAQQKIEKPAEVKQRREKDSAK